MCISCSRLLSWLNMMQEAGQKRKRNEDEETCQKFLEEFAALPLENLNSEEVVTQAKQLFCRIEEQAKNSPYIAKLIAGI